MKTELLRQSLGEKINYCTKENFEMGYDPIGDVINDFEIYSECSAAYELFYESILTPEIHTEIYYDKIFDEICDNINLIQKLKNDFNEEKNQLFKDWFMKHFSHKQHLLYKKNEKFNWSIKTTLIIMEITLEYLECDYIVHKTGGCTNYFFKIIDFLTDLANAPFEAEFFLLIEDDFGVFDDEK